MIAIYLFYLILMDVLIYLLSNIKPQLIFQQKTAGRSYSFSFVDNREKKLSFVSLMVLPWYKKCYSSTMAQ